MIELAGIEARARRLVDTVAGFRCGRLHVRGYRLNYSEGRSAHLGIHDSRVGGVYSPFQMSDGARGAVLIEWSDGRISRAALDGNAGDDLGPILEGACGARYRDDEARELQGRARIPTTPIYDPRVDRIAGGRFAPLYDTIDLIQSRGRRLKAKKVSGSAVAASGGSVIATSRGLWYAALSSECHFSFAYDAELWDGRARRRPIPLAEVARVIDRAALLLPSLRRKARGSASGPARVLAMPGFAEELVDAYVIGNLAGAEVASGQSAFRADDFRRRKRVFRDDLRLVVDPTVPYAAGSYRLTAEGVPVRRQAYVERGRLLCPIVGLKYARRLKMKPTTPPASMESVRLEMGAELKLPAGLRAVGDGYLVLSALGLHTQDTPSGDYSLTAPQAIRVQKGKLVGSAKVVIAGNFFAALRDPATRLVRVPGQSFPGLLFDCHVTVG